MLLPSWWWFTVFLCFFPAVMPKGRWLTNKCVLLYTQCSTLIFWIWLLGDSEEFAEEKRGSKIFSYFNCYKVVTQQKLIPAILVIPHLLILRLVSALNSSCQADWEKFIGLAYERSRVLGWMHTGQLWNRTKMNKR